MVTNMEGANIGRSESLSLVEFRWWGLLGLPKPRGRYAIEGLWRSW